MEERINFFPKKVVIEVSARTCRNFIMDTCLDDFMDYMFLYNSFTMSAYLDEKVCIEGMVTICLRCMVAGDRHFFRTQSNGMDISKSPEEMFDLEIENDLKFVDQQIREYWGLLPTTSPKEATDNG